MVDNLTIRVNKSLPKPVSPYLKPRKQFVHDEKTFWEYHLPNKYDNHFLTIRDYEDYFIIMKSWRKWYLGGKKEEGCKDLYLAINKGAKSNQSEVDSKCDIYKAKLKIVKNENLQNFETTVYKTDHWLDVKGKGGFSQAWNSPNYEKVEIFETEKSFKVTFGSKTYKYIIISRERFSERMTNNTVILNGLTYVLHVCHNFDGTYSINIDGTWSVPKITDISKINSQ